MTLAVTTTDSFATGVIANTGLGSRTNKSFSTGFQGQLIQISQKERLGIDKREEEGRLLTCSFQLCFKRIFRIFDSSPEFDDACTPLFCLPVKEKQRNERGLVWNVQ